jgi:hypothetical protein
MRTRRADRPHKVAPENLPGHLDAEAWERIAGRLEPYPKEDERAILRTVRYIMLDYSMYSIFTHGEPGRETSQKSLKCLSKAVKKVTNLWEKEYFRGRLVQSSFIDAQNKESVNGHEVLERLLKEVKENTEDALQGRKKLQIRSPSRKSAERLYLWEPLIELWKILGRRVRDGDGGRLARFISEVHEACGLPSPKALTLQEAIDAAREGTKDTERTKTRVLTFMMGG